MSSYQNQFRQKHDLYVYIKVFIWHTHTYGNVGLETVPVPGETWCALCGYPAFFHTSDTDTLSYRAVAWNQVLHLGPFYFTCVGEMHFVLLKAILLGLYRVLGKIFFTDCLIPLNQKDFEYLKIISYPVFRTFDQQICKYFKNHQFRERQKFQFWVVCYISYHDFGRLSCFLSLMCCVSKWKECKSSKWKCIDWVLLISFQMLSNV